MQRFYLISFILFGILFIWTSANAQIQNADVVVTMNPEFPNPNQNVDLNISSYVIDLDKSYIVWNVDGETLAAGIGKKSFSFTTKKENSLQEISINIETLGGKTINKTINISPASVDLLWEAVDSYTPPFYRGKALVSKEGTYKVVAIPNIFNSGEIVNYKNLSYLWNKDNQNYGEASGWGKNYFIYKHSYIDAGNTLNVKVSGILNGINASNQIYLTPGEPKIVFYQKDPILGIKISEAIKQSITIQDSVLITAIPYFVNSKNINSDTNLVFNWFMNQQPLTTPDIPNEIGLETQSKNGVANIKLVVKNLKALVNDIEKELIVSF